MFENLEITQNFFEIWVAIRIQFYINKSHEILPFIIFLYYFQYSCGKDKDNNIRCNGANVAGKHCIFFHYPNEVYVKDLSDVSLKLLKLYKILHGSQLVSFLTYSSFISFSLKNAYNREFCTFFPFFHKVSIFKNRTQKFKAFKHKTLSKRFFLIIKRNPENKPIQ